MGFITTALTLGLSLLPQSVAGVPHVAQVKRASEITHTGISYWGHAGLGACGFLNTDNDPIVGISTIVFGTGGNCNQWMEVTNVANGKTVLVQTRDSCTGCGRNDILLSPSAFASIGDLNLGILNVQWHFKAKDFTPSITLVPPTPVPSSSSVSSINNTQITPTIPVTTLSSPVSTISGTTGAPITIGSPPVTIIPSSPAPSPIGTTGVVTSVPVSATPLPVPSSPA
ncbi:hypothetical protein NLI96_g8067 [Meripilus lineatus]|uniref:RlpA-like protein double-psi beta-barrel domain-containing protein n=1 Tax=Meripilus lineatus TaxID=2056292 RepID=A0AAD5UZL7_9APHY|nr:hypothetical protein NLI96_g8067 [Physisporinus lineatus]